MCPQGAVLQYAVVATNMATDAWLALAPLPLIWALNMPKERKIKVVVLLSSRLLYVFTFSRTSVPGGQKH